ncbi:hypothetical protein [Sphingomonas nostoxanthinifaciens]|uniref:hypothetical protein n=1 Tax=Sphingomonas nostoxanthinifaciens TaxID=2872652 RepID=UPI001CC21AF7|nr:hypothetical protein [Sphingomonas nostoxanthinifaciens]UAK26078.1 hypothetical protein K8P63_08225 [Sphingomonas nostoxanthinifaciens]
MFWNAWKLGSSLWANGLALQETAMAAAGVIGHRSQLIDSAMRDPLSADVAELGRMVPEKVEAFGKAGSAIAEDWLDIHRDLLAQSRDFATLFAAWPPSPATIARMNQRGGKLLVKMSTAGGRAIDPIHATATGNHRRLQRSTGRTR